MIGINKHLKLHTVSFMKDDRIINPTFAEHLIEAKTPIKLYVFSVDDIIAI